MATIQVRVDDDLKFQASSIYEKLGLDLSSAIRMFLKRSVSTKGIPFSMIIDDEPYDAYKATQAMKNRNESAKSNGIAEMTSESEWHIRESIMKVYIAGPLFSDGERTFNEKIDGIIRACGHETYLPQRDGGIVAQMPDIIDGLPKETYVFRKDLENLKACDLFLLLMDGRVPDEGACVALGYCLAHGKRCVGYKTDSRSGYDGNDNIMITGALENILRSEDDLRRFFGTGEI